MISCPHCKATLPDGTTYCQFCRNNFATETAAQAARRTQTDDDAVYTYPESKPLNLKWVYPVYYGIATWWVVNALISIMRLATSGIIGSPVGIILLLLTLFPLLVGVGLLCKVELARGYVNVICWLNILGGVLNLATSFILSLFPMVGLWGILGMFFAVVNIALSILMIFVIGETD